MKFISFISSRKQSFLNFVRRKVIYGFFRMNSYIHAHQEYRVSKEFFAYCKYDEKIILSKGEELKQDLDALSRSTIDKYIERIIYIYKNNPLIKNYYCDQEKKELSEALTNLESNKKYFSDFPAKDPSVFCYHNGLKFLDKSAINNIENFDCIDAGAHLGDSALIFHKYYNFHKIYCFEPVMANFSKLEKNLIKYKINNAVPVKMGLGKKRGVEKITDRGGSSAFSENGDEVAEIISIDNFVREKNIKIGLIKMDIEGSETSALLGAIETIKKFSPVLLISIYHSAKDFFEIRNIIEKFGNYQFVIRRLNPLDLFTEVYIIAWPK